MKEGSKRTTVSDAGYLSVDLGGTRIEHALADEELSIRQRITLQTGNYPRPGPWIQKLIGTLPAAEGIPWVVGVPSPVESRRRITETPNLPPGWSGDAITEALRRNNVDYRLENDANLAALGESTFGEHPGVNNLVLLTLGTGLGCGIVIDRDLYRGSTGGAGELGHVVMVPGGRRCGCGKQGCLEQYASATGLEITYSKRSGVDRSAEEIMSRLDEDPHARQAAGKTARHLGRALALPVNLLEPQRVVLSGGLSESFDKIRQSVRTHFRDNVFASRLWDLPISTSSLDNPALYGGLALLEKE